MFAPFTARAIISLMPQEQVLLAVTHLEVYDDLAEQTYTVALEDVVKQFDDHQHPGAHRDVAIRMLNSETKNRHPQWVTADGRRFALVTADEYSDIKLNLIMRLLKWVTADGSGGDDGSKVM